MDNRGDYWIFNHTGCLTYITADSGKIKEFRLIPQDKLSYIDFERYHIVHDSRGIIWISTYGNGLFAYDTAEDKLEHFLANINDKKSYRFRFPALCDGGSFRWNLGKFGVFRIIPYLCFERRYFSYLSGISRFVRPFEYHSYAD